MTITIPPEALEAAAREIYIEWIRGCLLDDPTASIEDYEPWKHLDELERGHYFSSARAAILAALKAWTGKTEYAGFDADNTMRHTITLPTEVK